MTSSRMTWAIVSLSLTAACAEGTTSNINLGMATAFAVLGGSTVTNTGATVVNGDLGVWPGLAVTGFGPGIVTNGTVHAGDSVAMQAHEDLTAGYNAVAGQACGTDLSGQDLGGLTLTSGVYCFSSSAQLLGTLTLDAQGDPNAVFFFQIGGDLTTAAGSFVLFSNGLGMGTNIYWQVASSATLGTNTSFAGNLLSTSSITLTTNASISCGRALALTGAVTMDTNAVSVGCDAITAGAPEPNTAGLLGIGAALCLIVRVRPRVVAYVRQRVN